MPETTVRNVSTVLGDSVTMICSVAARTAAAARFANRTLPLEDLSAIRGVAYGDAIRKAPIASGRTQHLARINAARRMTVPIGMNGVPFSGLLRHTVGQDLERRF